MPSTNPADYPNFGMRVPITLDDVFFDRRFKDIVTKSIKEQAKFADAVCVANANDENFCKKALTGTRENPEYEKWNSTSIGNCAYLALYGCPETRKAYREILDKGVAHFRTKFGVESTSPDSCLIM